MKDTSKKMIVDIQMLHQITFLHQEIILGY